MVRCTYVTVTWHVSRDIRVAYQEYELCICGVPAALLSSIPRTCYEFLSAHMKKRSTSAYEEYELRMEEYELRMLTYVRHTRDVPFVT